MYLYTHNNELYLGEYIFQEISELSRLRQIRSDLQKILYYCSNSTVTVTIRHIILYIAYIIYIHTNWESKIQKFFFFQSN